MRKAAKKREGREQRAREDFRNGTNKFHFARTRDEHVKASECLALMTKKKWTGVGLTSRGKFVWGAGLFIKLAARIVVEMKGSEG